MMNIRRDVELYADKENHLFPLFDESDVTNAAAFFGLSQNKKDVASAINKRAEELGMKIEANKISDFRRFCAKDILVGDEFAKNTCVKAEDMDKLLADRLETSEKIKKFEKNYFKYRKGYNYINGMVNSSALFYFCLMMDLYDILNECKEDNIVKCFHNAAYLFDKSETTIDTKKILSLLYSTLDGINPITIDDKTIDETSFDSIINSSLKRTIKCVSKECEKMKEDMELKTRFRDKTQRLNYLSISSNMDDSISGTDLSDKISSIINNNPSFLSCGGTQCKTELSGKSLLMFRRIYTNDQFSGSFYSESPYTNRKLHFLVKDSNQVILVVTDKNDDNLYFIYLDMTNLEKPYKKTKVKITVPETNNLMESFTIDEDGSVKIELTKRTNLMDEYDTNHKRIKEAYKNNNLDEVKLLLAYDFALLDRIEHDLNNKKLSKAKREELVKAKQFLMNDFKTYLRLVTKKEPKFNFTKYYDSCDEIKKFFVVDRKTINGIKALLRNILL